MPAEDQDEAIPKRRIDWRTLILVAIAVLLLCFLLPPLVNLSQFDRRISASISSSLGRPVHVDHAGIRILPTPALTLEDFVVSENPAFGNEPVISAASVTATLRVSSLWRRRIEISSISLDEPSINLTRNPAGDWNFKGILLQAASIPTAPTDPTLPKAPAAAGRPRFPYVEATNARVNFIVNREKLPFSLTDSDFALWQANDGRWHIRVRTTPSRTDMNLTDTGLLRLDGALGPAVGLGNSANPTTQPQNLPATQPQNLNDLPIALELRWQDVQLGEFTRLILGNDLNWRGVLNSRTTLTGTLAAAQLHTVLNLNGFRAADVVPPDSLALTLTCDATQQSNFQRVDNLLCNLPIPADSGPNGSLYLAGTLADPRNLLNGPTLANMQLHLTTAPPNPPATTESPAPKPIPDPGPNAGVDAATLLRIARRTDARIPQSLALTGRLTANFALNTLATPAAPKPHAPAPTTAPSNNWTGTLHGENLTLQLPPSPPPTTQIATTLYIPTLTLTTAAPEPTQPHSKPHSKSRPQPSQPTTFTLDPLPLALGGATPATLTAKFTATGYTLHLTGAATPQKLRALQTGIPWLTPTEPDTEPTTPTHPEPIHPEATHIDITTQNPWQHP